MFKKVTTLVLMTVLCVTLVAKQAHAEEKIALVSLQKALNEVEEGKRAKAKLQKDIDVKKKQIDSLKAEFETMSKQLEKDKTLLSQDAYKTKTQELQTKYLEIQNKASTFERDIRTQELESSQKIILSLRQVVKDISAKDGYTLVIENSAETVLFSKNAEDITTKVIAAFNKK